MKKKKNIGPVTTLIFLTFICAFISSILSIIGFEGTVTYMTNNTLETSLITVENILSYDGIRYLFLNIVDNFILCKPLVLLIISLIGSSICEQSGLLKAQAESIKKYKSSVITFVVLLIGFIFSFIGDYSYIIFLPLIGVIYKYLNRNAIIGIITLFLGVTIGKASGFLVNYDSYLLGILTQTSANLTVDKEYIFALSSNLFIMIASSIIFLFTLCIIITKYIEYKFPKPEKLEDELIVSKNALKATYIGLLIIVIILICLLIPGFSTSGLLLDIEQENYIAKLFSINSPFNNGLVVLSMVIMMICGLIYGKVSGNIKTSSDYNKGLSKSFSKAGYIFVLLFFSSLLTSILNYTHIPEVICVNLVEMVGNLNFTGVVLILTFFIITLLITLIMPSLESKWILMSPIIIPLFMKANISPNFAQFIFSAASSIGNCITPFFIYFLIMIGFMEKYNETNSRITIIDTMKILIKPAILITVIWLLIIIGWYIVGLPIGIRSYPTL